MAAKPRPEPKPIERWTAQRKAAIILDVLKDQISVPEAARKYGFTQNEYRRWADEYHRAGVEALKTNRKMSMRSISRIKRLSAKFGQVVMDDDIRQEAMHFSFGRSDVERVVANGKRARQRVCRLRNVPRRTSYYHRRQRTPIVDELLAQRIKRLIDGEPYLC
jgi:transposase-like protein